MPTVELIYFDGCPNVDAARDHLRQALAAARLPAIWQEWNQHDAQAPDRVRQFGSPTVLVDGRDVTCADAGVAAAACRADGAPSTETIRTAVAQASAG